MDALLEFGLDEADLVVTSEDLARDHGLVSAIYVSLFSDGRAPAGELEPGEDPRGWWAEGSERYGSLLWRIERAKASTETAERARQAASDALAWVIEERIARAVDVEAAYVSRGLLRLSLRIHRGDAPRWAHLWDAMVPFERRVGGLLLALEVV